MVAAGELGEINAVRAFYIQGWLRTRLEAERPEAGRLADRPEQVRRGRLLRRHRHARLQPRPLHHRPAARADQLPPEDVRDGRKLDDYGTAVIRFENGAPGHGHRVADQPRPRERPVHRDRRHEGGAGVAPGGAEQDDRPPQRPAARGSTRATRAPYLTDVGQGGLPAAQRPPGGVLRGVRQRLPRAYDAMVQRAEGKKFETREHHLPERRRRRGGDELHHAVRGQQQGERRLAAAEAQTCAQVGAVFWPSPLGTRPMRTALQNNPNRFLQALGRSTFNGGSSRSPIFSASTSMSFLSLRSISSR